MCVVLQERTPLHVAVRSGLGELALEVARSLIDAGADPALLCKGRSTLHEAAIQREAPMAAMLLAAAKSAQPSEYLDYINCIGRDGWSALGLAARAGDAAVVGALIDAGADSSVVMPTGKTALEIARLNKKGAGVVKLLES